LRTPTVRKQAHPAPVAGVDVRAGGRVALHALRRLGGLDRRDVVVGTCVHPGLDQRLRDPAQLDEDP
jgi:hypothetical protein